MKYVIVRNTKELARACREGFKAASVLWRYIYFELLENRVNGRGITA